MDIRLLIIPLVLLLIILIILAVYLIVTDPSRKLSGRRRKDVFFEGGADVYNGRISHNTSGLNAPESRRGTVVIGSSSDMNGDTGLIVLERLSDGVRFRIRVDRYVILGRQHDNEPKGFYAVTDAMFVARQQCMIVKTGGRYYIADNASRNHTYLNGQEVVESSWLKEGDLIAFGGAGGERFRLHLDSSL